ncbi:hypothetical protein Tco_1370337 [Tanacetum coccineum]
MQTQEDHSNLIPALNVDSLKVDLVVIHNTCSEKEESNSETASSKLIKECNLNSETKDVHAIKYKMSKAKGRCMTYFQSLHSHLQVLSKGDLKGTRIEHGFKREFMSLFGQDVDTFTRTMILNVDQLQKKLDKDELQEIDSLNSLWFVNKPVQKFIEFGWSWKAMKQNQKVQDDISSSGNETEMLMMAYTGPIYDKSQWIIESPMLDSSPDNQTTEYSKQSLESENILLKKTVAQFQKDFSRMEAHCIALELKYQNQALKSGQHGQILNETSNKAKITRKLISKTTEQTTSLLANNAELKAQIQEKVFAIAACIKKINLSGDLMKLVYGIPSDGPYQTNPPSIEDIISSIRINREGQVRRIRHEDEIDVLDYQILTREIIPTLKPLKEIIQENVFCLGGNQDHVPACLYFMLYCVVHSERFNLAYFMAKRMEWLYNESYVLYDRVMNPLAAQLEQKPRRDRGTRRGSHSTSSSSAFDQPSSSHLNDDDDDGNDEGTSCASTPPPIHYANSLTDQVPQLTTIPSRPS